MFWSFLALAFLLLADHFVPSWNYYDFGPILSTNGSKKTENIRVEEWIILFIGFVFLKSE